MRSIFLFCMMLFLIPSRTFSYEVNVHRAITERAILTSNMNQYVSNNIGIAPLKDTFNDKLIWQWISDGSEWEDNYPRWANHFYDPTTGRGLNVNVYEPVLGTVLFTVNGESSLPWAKASSNNENSWKRARDAYYKALTESTPNSRNTNFSYVFKDLGQVLHLVQDLSVPSHVRNDCHLTLDWLPVIGSIVGPTVEMTVQQKDMYEKYTKDAPLKYDGYPAVDTTTAFTILDSFWKNDGKGLAEFTNRNFVSRDTNFDDLRYRNYNLPIATGRWVSMEQVPDYRTSGFTTTDVNVTYSKGYVTDYYKGDTSKTIDRLTAYSYFDFEMKLHNLDREVYSLNNKVHKEYADFLIPRAVGYSAGLLNYFFRGQIDMAPDLDNPGSYIIKNFTNETLIGKFELYYDDKEGKRQKVPLSQETLTVGGMSGDKPGKSIPVTFIAPTDPEPEEKGKYILVFQGALGSEQGAVVGKVVNLENIWEDWEYGLTGRHGWPQAYTVIDGFEANRTKVLKITGGGIATHPETPLTLPQKASFDYYVKSFGMDPRNYLGLRLGYNSAPYVITSCVIGLYNPGSAGYCGTSICKTIERDSWIHVEGDIKNVCSSSWTQSQVERVEIEIGGSSGLGALDVPTEIYIDNITFK